MPEIDLLCVGKQKFPGLGEIGKRYIQKINRFVKFNLRQLKEVKSENEDQIKKRESENILKSLADSDFVVALDEKGKKMDSIQFANFLEQKMSYFPGKLVFLIGGFAGFDPILENRINQKLSFSDMTMAHDVFRVVFLEQLYRAFTIMKGIKYHR
jgi:23S rRNA (pseudouridine1915-N3)-methyltransferase